MDIREFFQTNKVAGVAVGVALVGAAVALVYWTNNSDVPKAPSKAFYTTDDGATYFEDGKDNVPPYDRGGKKAYRAVVYRCGETNFVAYMEGMSELGRTRLNQLKGKQLTAEESLELNQVVNRETLVKRPKGDKWVSSGSVEGAGIMVPKCPEGNTGPLEAVYP